MITMRMAAPSRMNGPRGSECRTADDVGKTVRPPDGHPGRTPTRMIPGSAARFTASVGALVGSCAIWWMLLAATAASLDREIANATSVLNACASSDVALAATRMRVWRDGPLFRSTERVVAMLQHAMSGSSPVRAR